MISMKFFTPYKARIKSIQLNAKAILSGAKNAGTGTPTKRTNASVLNYGTYYEYAIYASVPFAL